MITKCCRILSIFFGITAIFAVSINTPSHSSPARRPMRNLAQALDAVDVQGIGGVSASSSQDENPPLHAFDSDPKTRWCAVSNKFPQWIQADLGQARRVDRATLSWERTTETYRCRIVGSTDGQHWVTLFDGSKEHGIGDGTVSLRPQSVRYVRLLVLGSSTSGWASLWEISIKYLETNGQETAWHPQRPGSAL